MSTYGTDEQLRALIDYGLPYRTLEVPVSRADERRLRRAVESFNDQTPDAPMNPRDDSDLAIVFAGAAFRGLCDGESDDGVWAGTDGQCLPLPRRVRSSWRMRLAFAWRAAVTTWRAT